MTAQKMFELMGFKKNKFDYLRNYYLGVVDKPKEDWEMK